jgi:hypothetical protein
MQKITRSLVMASALAFAGVLAGCGDDVTVSNPTTVTVTPGSATLKVGESVTLTASVATDKSNKAVTWSTSDAAKASVSTDGKVTAIAAGNATITATAAADAGAKSSALITITADKGVQSVTVAPLNAILAPGQTLQAAATVATTSGVAKTVTWASSAAATATVDATGKITAVAPGTATITATSTVDNTVTGALALTVRAPVPASISIQKVTVTGNTAGTVNFNNVAGGIDVTLNVDPGDQVINKVDVLLDNNVVCSQTLSPSQSQALSLAAVFEEVQAVDIVCQINTAEFNAQTGAVKFTNGSHTLSARATVAGGGTGGAATPSVNLTFNNQSGIVVTVSNSNGTDAASAVNATSGLQWIGGDVTVNVVGVSYASGISVSSATFTLFGKARTVALTNNVGSATYAEATTWTAGNTGVGNYLSPAVGETFAGASAVLSNGQNLVTSLPNVILNFGTLAQGNANVPILPTIRLDNTAPGATSANGIAQTALTIGTMPVWVNATTAFAPGSVGIPTATTITSSESATGVNNVTTTVFYGAVGTLLPAGSYNPGGLSNLTGACNVTGLTALTVGQNLPETIVSGSYQARVQFKDALGNVICYDLNPTNALNPGANGSFGADFTAPTATMTGPAANSSFIALGAVGSYAVAATDNASGFGATPLNVVVTRTNANAANTCVIGTVVSGVCTAAARALTFDPTNAVASPANEGYYNVTITLLDQAGNTATLTTARTFLLDDPAQFGPTATADAGFTGGISLPSVIAGATTNAFTATPVDDIDLASVFGVTAYANGNLQYPSQSLGTYNTPLERGGAAIQYNVSNWVRCLNVAGDFVSTNTQPTQITMFAVDQAGNQGSLASPAFGANAQACNGVGDVAINTFGPITTTFAATKTQVDIDGATLAAASDDKVVLTVVADVPLNTSNNPFSRVDFYYQNAAGRLVLIDKGSAVLAQTATNRTWTYTLTWNPDANVQVGAVNVVAVGVDLQGDAVLSNAIAAVQVTTVP